MVHIYIRHLINTRNGRRVVDFKQVICETCTKCKKDIPRIYFGYDPKSNCAVNAVYKYVSDDIIEEHSSINKSMLPKECNKAGCNEYKYI
jgi:hypothetical protein